MQTRIFDYHAPEDTALLNGHFRDLLRVGVHAGFQVEPGSPGFVNIRAGVLLTREGVRLEESADLADALAIPPNTASDLRVDLIVCRHSYLKTVPPPPALYEILTGTPDPAPVPPLLPEDAVLLARAEIAAGGTDYAAIHQAQPDVAVNAWFNGRRWRILRGALAAFLVEYDINYGAIRFYVQPGGVLADDTLINWGAPKLTLDASGHVELNTEMDARIAADAVLQAALDAEAATREADDTALQNALDSEAGTRASADVALQSEINAEEATRAAETAALRSAVADTKGTAWDQAVPDNDDLASVAGRVGILESASGIPAHRTRHESGGDDALRFDQLADGTTYKKMTAVERTKLAGIEAGAEANNLSDAQATELTGGGNTALHHHDGRYFTEAEADARFYNVGEQVADADTVDGQHASAFALAGHNHDVRYLRRVYVNSQLYNPNQVRVLTTLADAPELVTIAYNNVDANGIPQSTTFVFGGQTANLRCEVAKVDNGGDKDYQITVRNLSSNRLYISVAAYAID